MSFKVRLSGCTFFMPFGLIPDVYNADVYNETR